MPKKKKVKKKAKKTKARRVVKPKAKVAKGKKVSKRHKAPRESKVVPIMGYRVDRIVKVPKGPQLKKTPFSKSELGVFTKLLMDLKRRIVGSIKSIETENLNTGRKDSTGGGSGYSFHVTDAASDSFDRELNIGLAANSQELLNDIAVASRKIEEGTFGICEKYGIAIPKKRLLAAPYVRLCLQAQEEEEREPRRS